MKRDGNASDHLRKQAAANPQDELAAGLSGQPESIQPEALLAQVLDRANLQRALKQVRRNKGAPGIDGMTVDELPKYLRDHWLEIGAQLEAGSYCPQPVKRVDIPKPDGKTRPLGIPTVLDRFIQQAIAQVISAQWEPHFHRHSYAPKEVPLGDGFRPQRSAHQAVREVQGCESAACRSATRGIPASRLMVRGGYQRHRHWRSRYHCASSPAWDYRTLHHGRNSIHRTAGYVTRTSGGVGGGSREAFSYPD